MKKWLAELIATAIREALSEAVHKDLMDLHISLANRMADLRKEQIALKLSLDAAMQQRFPVTHRSEQHKDEEAALQARKRALVPGLTPEMDAQIDWSKVLT